ncbi:MAG: Gfo/Idh/MocA family oxidoreductase, partial [Bacteroidota bacterium]
MKLKIAIFGVGHLGNIHIKCIQQIPELELIGFYDPSDENAAKAKSHGLARFHDEETLIKM